MNPRRFGKRNMITAGTRATTTGNMASQVITLSSQKPKFTCRMDIDHRPHLELNCGSINYHTRRHRDASALGSGSSPLLRNRARIVTGDNKSVPDPNK